VHPLGFDLCFQSGNGNIHPGHVQADSVCMLGNAAAFAFTFLRAICCLFRSFDVGASEVFPRAGVNHCTGRGLLVASLDQLLPIPQKI
jgi:hypothetical protein